MAEGSYPANTELRSMTLEEREQFGELFNPWGNPRDRRWPDNQTRRAIRPVEYGWYEMSAEQRAGALMNSWVLINLAIDQEDFSEIDDETFVVLAWGINDKDAIRVARNTIPYPDIMFGEGENQGGWLRINSDNDAWFDWGTKGYGTEMMNRIKDTANTDRPWINKAFYDPGEMQLFQDALDGGNATEREQRAQLVAEKGIKLGTSLFMAGMAWPSVAAKLSAAARAGLSRSMGGLGISGSPNTGFWAGLSEAQTAFMATNAGRAGSAFRTGLWRGTVGAYVASLGLGVTDNVDDVYASVLQAVDKGEMSEEEAELIASVTASVTGPPPGYVSNSSIWSGAIALDAPVESWMGKVIQAKEGTGIYAKSDINLTPALLWGNFAANAFGQLAPSLQHLWEAGGGYTETTTPTGEVVRTPGYRLDPDAQDAADRAAEEIAESQKGPRRIKAEQDREAARQARRGAPVGGMAPDSRFRSTITQRGVNHPAYADMDTDPGAAYAYETHVPRYFEQDYEDIMGNWSIDKTEWFQRQAILAGLIDPESDVVRWGSRDPQTRAAFTSVLTEANSNGNTWEDQLGEMGRQYQEWLVDNPEEEQHYPAFVTPAYRKPDYATLAQQTKTALRNVLQRRPSSAELQLLTDHLGALDRQQWSGQVAAERAEHAARAREWESGLDGQTPQEQSAGTVQQVDALARFDEFFENKYAGEIAHRERVDAVQEKTPGLMASLNRIAGSM